MGNGFQEVIYQRALDIELVNHKLLVAREMEMAVLYKGTVIGSRRVEFLRERNKINFLIHPLLNLFAIGEGANSSSRFI